MTATKTKAKAEAAAPIKEAPPATLPARAGGAAKNAVHQTLSQPQSVLQAIMAAATNPAVDVAKMQQLLDMHERLSREQARRDFIAAKLRLRPTLPVIDRDGKIVIEPKPGSTKKGQKTPYATFENIMEQIERPLQAQQFDLWYSTEPSPDGTRIHVIGHLQHEGGHEERTVFPMPAETSGSKNNAQGWMSAFSYGKRGATIALLNIRTRDPRDADKDGHPEGVAAVETETGDDAPKTAIETIDEKQIETLREVMESFSVSVETLTKFYKIKKLSDLPADCYEDAIQNCKNYRAKREG